MDIVQEKSASNEVEAHRGGKRFEAEKRARGAARIEERWDAEGQRDPVSNF
jgi:hypothetical protein